eukprot:TRINITY_DN16657_c0_g1_i1.p1 TRINITY_DN16657_c0_g1~~TRINITY_DN16657_c0_g1_i1.p1  ORF type:complete len:297 (-),score=46.95 TRINITY_DN16657_c0_g1_i1:23-913(-)
MTALRMAASATAGQEYDQASVSALGVILSRLVSCYLAAVLISVASALLRRALDRRASAPDASDSIDVEVAPVRTLRRRTSRSARLAAGQSSVVALSAQAGSSNKVKAAVLPKPSTTQPKRLVKIGSNFGGSVARVVAPIETEAEDPATAELATSTPCTCSSPHAWGCAEHSVYTRALLLAHRGPTAARSRRPPSGIELPAVAPQEAPLASTSAKGRKSAALVSRAADIQADKSVNGATPPVEAPPGLELSAREVDMLAALSSSSLLRHVEPPPGLEQVSTRVDLAQQCLPAAVACC